MLDILYGLGLMNLLITPVNRNRRLFTSDGLANIVPVGCAQRSNILSNIKLYSISGIVLKLTLALINL